MDINYILIDWKMYQLIQAIWNKVAKLDADRLVPLAADLSKKTDTVKRDVDKRCCYDQKYWR